MEYSEFSEGERYMQQLTGEQETAFRNARIVKPVIVPQLYDFIKTRQVFFIASIDGQGRVWASVLSGRTGFVITDQPNYLCIDPDLVVSNANDIFWKNIQFQSEVGILFIDLISRMRYRINGTIIAKNNGYLVEVDQAFANCPKYIQRRQINTDDSSSTSLGQDLRAWVKRMDTFFVASADKHMSLDISHKGGNPGFIQWMGDDVLRIPDYTGNSMFMTLGNFYENPEAGLLFVDFTNGETVQMTGHVTFSINKNGTENFNGQPDRFWDFTIGQVRFDKSLPNFSTALIDYSPYNPPVEEYKNQS